MGREIAQIRSARSVDQPARLPVHQPVQGEWNLGRSPSPSLHCQQRIHIDSRALRCSTEQPQAEPALVTRLPLRLSLGAGQKHIGVDCASLSAGVGKIAHIETTGLLFAGKTLGGPHIADKIPEAVPQYSAYGRSQILRQPPGPPCGKYCLQGCYLQIFKQKSHLLPYSFSLPHNIQKITPIPDNLQHIVHISPKTPIRFPSPKRKKIPRSHPATGEIGFIDSFVLQQFTLLPPAHPRLPARRTPARPAARRMPRPRSRTRRRPRCCPG